MITGGCHCGTIKYEITSDIRMAQYCHCQTCRKIHGTQYATSAVIPAEGFRITAGEDALVEYESSPGKKRCFCPRCGSHIYAYKEDNPEMVILRLGTVDGDPGVRPSRHVWVSQKAPWYEIHDDLPRLEEM